MLNITTSDTVHTEAITGPRGISLHTCAVGNPAATHKLICIHGGMQAKECFSEQYSWLAARDCFLVGFDLPWHGQSGPGEGHEALSPSPDLWADSLAALLRHYRLEEQEVVFLAWSMGGLVLRNFLQLRRPARIAGIVLVGSTLDFVPYFHFLAQEAPEIVSELAGVMDRSKPAQEQHAALLALVDRLWVDPPSRGQYYATLGYNFRSFLQAGRVMSDSLASQVRGDTAAFLHHLDCPILLVRGQEDALIPRGFFRDFISKLKPEQVSLLEPSRCGHSPFLEAAGLFNTAVLEFLNGPAQPGRDKERS
jgi:pimeloyl-ACP methyl ester carboxylesterase